MTIQELKKTLEQKSDKMSIASSKEEKEKYKKDIMDIILNLTEEDIIELLNDVNFVTNRLHILIDTAKIIDIIMLVHSEHKQKEITDMYQLEPMQKSFIISKFKDEEYKINILFEDKSLKQLEKVIILQSLEIETLIKFFAEHKNYFRENNIHPYDIVLFFNIERQMNFITKLDKINLTLNEKKEIMAVINDEVKEKIDITNLSEE